MSNHLRADRSVFGTSIFRLANGLGMFVEPLELAVVERARVVSLANLTSLFQEATAVSLAFSELRSVCDF